MGAGLSLDDATSATGASAKDDEKAKAVFLKAGKMRGINPGVTLIEQGSTASHMYMIMNGEVVLKRTTADGEEQQVGRRGAGQVIGELSFLLGTPATVNVIVPATASQAVTVVEVELKRALDMLQKQPLLAVAIFRLLATMLAERVADTSVHRKEAALHVSQHVGGVSRSEAAIGGPVPFSAFGLDPIMRLVTSVHAAVRVHDPNDEGGAGAERSASDGLQGRMPAIVYLLDGAIGIEVKLGAFTTHHTFRYSTILLIRASHAAEDGVDEESPTLEVSCTDGRVLYLSVASARFAEIGREIEVGRLAAIDTTVAVSRVSGSEPDTLSGMDGMEGKRRGAGGVRDSVVLRAYDNYLSNQELEQDAEDEESNASLIKVLGRMSAEEWKEIMKCAEHKSCKRGQAIVREGDTNAALYQITNGKARVEIDVDGRPQAVVVAELTLGAMFGERSFLLNEPAKASVVTESESASVLVLSQAPLIKLFHSGVSQQIAGKFFFFLALDLARRLNDATKHADEAARYRHEDHGRLRL